MSLAPRKSALSILTDIGRGTQTLDHLMDRFHAQGRFDRRDEAFVTALVYGVLRWRSRLDWVINTVSTTPATKMDPEVVNIIRMGLYQILYMDRVPNSAAVNTAVDLAKTMKKKWLAGFVNAVLRNALRQLPHIEYPSTDNEPVLALAVKHAMPEWLVKRWVQQFGGRDAALLCEATNRIPPLTLRTNTLKIDPPALISHLHAFAQTVQPSDYIPEGITLEGLRARLFSSPAFEQGWFQIQDEAAQAVSYLLAPKSGQTVLDACAGLGGKTAHMAALMKNIGRIKAVDRDGRKIETLESEMQRLGIRIVSTGVSDLLSDIRQGATIRYDCILLDAPCSGLGVIRRNPDAKWTRTPDDIDRCARRQMQLLDKLVCHLKPGGVMVYAVCSTEPEETRDVVKSFLNKHADFVIDDTPPDFPAALNPLVGKDGWLETATHRHGTDGFFAIRFRLRPTV